MAQWYKNPPAGQAGDPGDMDSILGSRRSAGEGNAIQSSSLENRMNRGGWGATPHGVAKLSN